jgi:hypothetical protein
VGAEGTFDAATKALDAHDVKMDAREDVPNHRDARDLLAKADEELLGRLSESPGEPAPEEWSPIAGYTG